MIDDHGGTKKRLAFSRVAGRLGFLLNLFFAIALNRLNFALNEVRRRRRAELIAGQMQADRCGTSFECDLSEIAERSSAFLPATLRLSHTAADSTNTFQRTVASVTEVLWPIRRERRRSAAALRLEASRPTTTPTDGPWSSRHLYAMNYPFVRKLALILLLNMKLKIKI